MPKVNLPKKSEIPKRTVVAKKEYCCICMSDIDPRNVATINSCEHTYCKSCINEWRKTQNSCPQCRKVFTEISFCSGSKDTVVLVEDRVQRPDHYPENAQVSDTPLNIVLEDGHMLEANLPSAYQDAADLRAIRSRRDGIMQLQRILIHWYIGSRSESLNSPDWYEWQMENLLYLFQFDYVRNYFGRFNYRRVDPLSIPLTYLYTARARILSVMIFTHDRDFRERLALALDFTGTYSVREKTAAQMIFNVLNRFFTLSNVNILDPNASEVVKAFKECHNVVFPRFRGGMQGHLVDVENDVQRVPHEELLTRAYPCVNIGLVDLFNRQIKQIDRETVAEILNNIVNFNVNGHMIDGNHGRLPANCTREQIPVL